MQRKPAARSQAARKRSSAAPAKKKLVIKTFVVQPKLPEDFEERSWEKLRLAVRAVQQNEAVTMSREELYRAVEDLCVHKMAARLFARLQSECASHVRTVLTGLQGQTPEHTAFLRMVQNVWDGFCSQMATLRAIFLHLDRTYVIQSAPVKSLWDMGLTLFRETLEGLAEVHSKLVAGLLALVERERSGEVVDRGLLKTLVRMLSALGLYRASFEGPFLRATREFYEAEGARQVEESDAAHFLRHAERRLQEEQDRVMLYLDASSRRALVGEVEDTLIRMHSQALLDKGFQALMAGDRVEDLHRMYRLFSRVGAVQALRGATAGYVVATVRAVVQDAEKDKVMVKELLSIKQRVDTVLKDAFASNRDVWFAVKTAFEEAINARQNRPAELIAKFVDQQLRSGNKGVAEDEVEALLDRAMDLFRFISGKDVFEAFYKKDLAKRLLLGKSASADLEKSMLQKLKNECGASFTAKLEGMFKDIDLSKDLMASFRETQHAKDIAAERVEAHVHVLTTSFWPPYPPTEVVLPEQLARYQRMFEAFYLARYNGRRLAWQHLLGTCVLKAHFPNGRKELSVSLLQAVVLMLFNRAPALTVAEMRGECKLADKDLKRALQSLACGKIRVLNKANKGSDVADDERFEFNSRFKAKLIRLKINAIQMKETKEEKAATDEHVFRNRQYQIDAAIVRIMKTRKVLPHQQLISEVFSQLRFPAKPADLKKRIESLIEREYLERDESDPNVYNYLA